MISNDLSETNDQGRTSYLKQLAMERYAAGDISLREMTAEFSQIAPPPVDQSWKAIAVALFCSAIVAILTPPWARRDDG